MPTPVENKPKSKFWMNITLDQCGKEVHFGIALDFFLKTGTAEQKEFVEAFMKAPEGRKFTFDKLGITFVEGDVTIVGKEKKSNHKFKFNFD